MISYDNCWETMKKKGVSKYTLIYKYGISSNTLRRMKQGEPITTGTINELCLILDCKPQDILSYEMTDSEKKYIRQKQMEIKLKSTKKS